MAVHGKQAEIEINSIICCISGYEVNMVSQEINPQFGSQLFIMSSNS